MNSIIDGKNKSDILDEFVKDYVTPDNKDHQIRKLAIQVKCVEDIDKSIRTLEASINRNSESSNNLARKVFYLDCILVFATAVIAVFTALLFLYPK
jgi:hypothetical protein